MKVNYYHLRDGRNRPVVTICKIETEHRIGYGISLCSLKDNPEKSEGRNLSNVRAWRAIDYKRSSEPIFSARAFKVINSFSPGEYVKMITILPARVNIPFFKSIYVEK